MGERAAGGSHTPSEIVASTRASIPPVAARTAAVTGCACGTGGRLPIHDVMSWSAVERLVSRPAVLLGAAVAITIAAVVVAISTSDAGQAYGLASVLYVPVVLAAIAGGQRAALIAAPVVTGCYVVALWSHGSGPLSLFTTGTVRLGVSLLVGVLIGSAVDRSREDVRVAQRQAAIDPLTGLGNRRALEAAWSRRRGAPVGVVMLDMDGLKALNDREGHAAGDHAIRALASAIERAVRPGDTIARVGGDEFVILVDVSTTNQLRAVADRISLSAHRAGVEASIGFALVPADANDLSTALADADERMYQLKVERGARRVTVLEGGRGADPRPGAVDAGTRAVGGA